MKTSTEKTYPIYYVRIKWSETYAPDAECRMHRVGEPPLPEGRFWNGTGWYIMEKEERPVEEIAAEIARDWWPQYAAKRLQPDDMTIEVTLKERDTWCSGWFSHWTWDTGLSDAEVRASFQDYVDRIQRSDRSESEIGGLLMGAADRWRWHGSATDDLSSEHTDDPSGVHTDAPCRCEHCKARGIVRIDH